MALTPFRWIAAMISGCLMVAVLLLRQDPPTRREAGAEERLSMRAQRLAGHATNTAERLRLVHLMDSLDAVIAQPTSPLSVRVFRDAALPSEYGAVLDSAAWRALRPVRDSGHVGIDILFVYDTVKSVRGATVRRYYSARADYVIPRDAGDRCLVIVHIPQWPGTNRPASAAWRSEGAAERLAGPCLYYRAFGLPGRHVDTWLRTRGLSFAAGGSWSEATAPVDLSMDRSWLYRSPTQAVLGMKTSLPFLSAMSVNAIHCAASDADACQRALLERERFGPVFLNGKLLNHPYPSWENEGWSTRGLGGRESLLLADMVRTVGRERFGRFWTSTLAVPAAFQSATGEPLGGWTTRWTVAQYGTMPGMGPGLSRTGGAMSLLFVFLALLVTLRAGARRQFA